MRHSALSYIAICYVITTQVPPIEYKQKRIVLPVDYKKQVKSHTLPNSLQEP